MGCFSSKSQNKTKIVLPANFNFDEWKLLLMKISMMIESTGDNTTLPKSTTKYIVELNKGKTQIDNLLNQLEQNLITPEKQSESVYSLFITISSPMCNIITILLNDKNFNESYPILRETFKENFHAVKKLQLDNISESTTQKQSLDIIK